MARRKKPAGDERRAAARTGSKREPWFDRARSLCELHGWPRSSPDDGRGLVGRYTAAVNRPVGQLDADDLVLLLTQGTDPRYLVPVALDRLHGHDDRALLRCLASVGAAYWREHPTLHAAFVAVAGAAAPRLAAAGDDDLAGALDYFLARARDR